MSAIAAQLIFFSKKMKQTFLSYNHRNIYSRIFIVVCFCHGNGAGKKQGLRAAPRKYQLDLEIAKKIEFLSPNSPRMKPYGH